VGYPGFMGQERRAELEAGLDHIRASPADYGTLELIVRRPAENEREVLAEGMLDLAEGLVGDMWRWRGSRDHGTGIAEPDRQITVMNARCAALVAQDFDRWPLAGDQLYVDFDLSVGNMPAGTRLRIGSSVIEATGAPHLGCGKFLARFGWDAAIFVNSRIGRVLQLRGMNARVVTGGAIRTGDKVRKLAPLEC
jgi:MOSC domain-containing protein YiiM